jgi:hypothetical protein
MRPRPAITPCYPFNVRHHAIYSVPQAAASTMKATVITAAWLPIACSQIGVHDGSRYGQIMWKIRARLYG